MKDRQGNYGYRIIAEKLDEVGNVVDRREAKGGGYFAAVSLTGMVDGKPAIAAMAEGYMTPDMLASALTNYGKETCTTVAFMLLAHNFADGAPGEQYDARGR